MEARDFRDIRDDRLEHNESERRRTEETLSESEERYRRLVDLSPDGVVVHSEGKLVYVNAATVRMFGGSSPEEFIGKPVIAFVHPESKEAVKERIVRMQRGEIVGLIEEKFLRLDGTALDVEVAAAPVVFESKPAIQVVFRDITERKKAEEDREQLAKRIQLLLESTDEGIYGLDAEGHTIIFNRAASEITGFKPEEVIGKDLHKLIHYKHPDGTPYAARDCPVIRALKLGFGSRIDNEVFWRKDGTPVPVEYSSYPIIEQGKIQGVVTTFTDITRRRYIEQALRESENRYRSLFIDSPVSLWEQDFSESKAYIDNLRMQGVIDIGKYLDERPDELLKLVSLVKIIDINRTTLDLFKARSKDEFKDNIAITFTDDSFVAFKRAVIAFIEGKTEFEMETTSRTLEGDKINVATRLFVPPGFEETLSRVFVAITDITERKRAEELSDALDNINSAISSTLNFDEIMQRVVVDSAKALGADVVGIALREDDRWVARYLYGFAVEQVGHVLSGEELKYIQLVIDAKEPVAISDALHDPRLDHNLMAAYGVKSLLVIPLVIKEKAIGVLRFVYLKSPVAFTDAHLDFAGKLGVSLSFAIENARLYETERSIADTLQEALLTIPEGIEGLEFGYLYRSATETAKVGGDFYDIFEMEHDKVGIVIGDVSGKGLEAATLTSLAKNTIKAYAYQGMPPALIMEMTNEVVFKATKPSIFITVFLGILDVRSGVLTYCSAGHPPGIVKRNNGEIALLITSSPIIGAFTHLNFIDDTTKLKKDDRLILYTDGVTEARCDGGFFGEENLLEFIKGMKPAQTKEIPRLIFNAIMSCTGGTLYDDMALLTVSLK